MWISICIRTAQITRVTWTQRRRRCGPASRPARTAGQLKIRIYTVALGTRDATVPNPNPFGTPLSVAPDPDTLRTFIEDVAPRVRERVASARDHATSGITGGGR